MYTSLPIILTFSLLLLPPSSSSATATTCRKPPSVSTSTATCPLPSDLILTACNGTTASLSDLEESCIQTLASDYRTASATTASEMATAATSVALEKAERTAELIGWPKKPAFKSCAESYVEVVEALRNAERLLAKHGSGDRDDVEDADVELGMAREAVDYCDLLLTVNKDDTASPVYAANREVYGHVIFAMSVADLL
ncbi:PREDICTED: uncharacterized protein LOC104826556 [Tarenaya hassleriana]|uniref:uncharacterized protein LOC104826556 n=1 Tax=Tarenaya hassleriana TaxID=28532 RepID=UPI00053C5734|nr:PREDICTED: uncharacterized protein LOC104826556 [Tarenaya hassleriana]